MSKTERIDAAIQKATRNEEKTLTNAVAEIVWADHEKRNGLTEFRSFRRALGVYRRAVIVATKITP